MQEKIDWEKWHSQYEVENSDLSSRLKIVQEEIRKAIPESPIDDFVILDFCAGDGRDIQGALKVHPSKSVVRGVLVEINPSLAKQAKDLLKDSGIKLDVLVGDAADTSLYEDFVPADLIMLCGVFGNVSDEDIENTISHLPNLCKKGAKIVWTRNRRAPDATPKIRSLFQKNNFQEDVFIAPDNNTYAVGINTFTGETTRKQDHKKLFTFIR